MILYERMVMIASPEIEVENELVKVRQNLAAQIKNNFTEDDPLAKLIEVNANEELLVVALVRNNASFSARRMEDGERHQFLSDLCREENIKQIIESSGRKDGDWPAGMRSLYKKTKHAEVAVARGQESHSYDDFRPIHYANSNIENVQGAAEALIWEIMKNPSTVIFRGRTTDIISKSGRGVRFYSHPTGVEKRMVHPFVGFTDANLYCNPLTDQDKSRLQQSESRRAL